MSLIRSLLMTEKDTASCVVLIKTMGNGADEIVSLSEGTLLGRDRFQVNKRK